MREFINLKNIFLLVSLSIASSVNASGGGVKIEPANNNVYDIKSLQNGAKLFMDYCSGCHSIEFMRYQRIADDLDISEEKMLKNFIFTDKKIGSNITAAVSDVNSQKWFGIVPPDLSLTARSKGADWIFSYLGGFYDDDTRPFGVNNRFLHNASMPDVLAKRQASLDKISFDNEIRDITNFLDYVSEPIQLHRVDIGIKVLLFLLILFIFSYLLKKEYWRDVKYGKWQAKN